MKKSVTRKNRYLKLLNSLESKGQFFESATKPAYAKELDLNERPEWVARAYVYDHTPDIPVLEKLANRPAPPVRPTPQRPYYTLANAPKAVVQAALHHVYCD